MEVNMSTQTILAAAFLVMVGTAAAQPDQAPVDVPMPPDGLVRLQPGVTAQGHSPGGIDSAAWHPVSGFPAPALLAPIVSWLSANFELPATEDLPQVRFVPPAVLLAIRCGASDGEPPAGIEPACGHARLPESEHDIVALYDDTSRTIYLQEGWTGATLAEFSVLVHEMVHHLQNLGGLVYECADARERPAFIAQGRWLELFGRTLESEFSIDPMTLFLRTTCPR
jgi:hypothetical protein